MQTVRQLLQEKGHIVWSIGPDESVYDAIKLMAEKGIGALIVVDRAKTVGMLSERDYARKVILVGRSSKETKIREIMTTQVISADPHQSVQECMTIMTEKRIRHLPVMEDDQLIGMISIGDLVKAIIAEQQFVISQLEHYISG
ncbi:MAG: histidine kinase [Candidatus Muproteobacteria bacterium RBG_16_60_9]|uniref:Histidine kinase n=1 Tax=Candidatus Muproteobacteria bacterium RBG_16_60_9 TaxID=1817755 RepID=A0A1F6V9A7_9PROT|nr:MAG: histidine kinase [Candidatus Muproteobacteria bacterium RBG_16_60_9]